MGCVWAAVCSPRLQARDAELPRRDALPSPPSLAVESERSQPETDGWRVAEGSVGAERVEKLTYHYGHTNYCTFLIKTWPHMKFAGGTDIKDGNFS